MGTFVLANAVGAGNCAFGTNTMFNTTIGEENVAIGLNAFSNNTIGTANIAIGTHAMNNGNLGNNNTAIGAYVMSGNTTGYNNAAIGSFALNANTSGYNNVALSGGGLNTTGHDNTFVGAGANTAAGTLTNVTAIGAGAIVNAVNKVRIGDATITAIEGQVAFSFPSDARFKYNVKDEVPGLAFISQLRPVTYNFDTEKFDAHLHKNDKNYVAKSDFTASSNVVHTGFLAQDIEKTCKELGFEFDGLNVPADANGNYSVSYSQFVMPLVKAVQELNTSVQTLQTENTELKAQLAELKTLRAEMTELKALLIK
jgi:trimeric autotransporter adhesin